MWGIKLGFANPVLRHSLVALHVKSGEVERFWGKRIVI